MTETLLDQGQDNPDDLAKLVEEAKTDPEKIAKRKYDSDLHIKSIERENAELRQDIIRYREEVNKSQSLQDILEQLKKNQSSSEEPEANDDVQRPALKPEEVEKIIDSRMLAREQARQEQENLNLFKSKLKEHYGNNQAALKEQIEELGLDEQLVVDLAKKNPKVLMRTFGLDQPVQHERFESPPRSVQRRDSFAPNVQKRTWAYYENMRKEQPALYNDPKIQLQMHNDAIELGPAFEDGDFRTG